MKRSIISLLTIVSLSLVNTQAMQHPNSVISIEDGLGFSPASCSHALSMCSDSVGNTFDSTSFKKTLEIFTPDTPQKNLVVDIIYNVFIMAYFSQDKKHYEKASLLVDYFKDYLISGKVFDETLFNQLVSVIVELETPSYISGSLMLVALRNGYFPAPEKFAHLNFSEFLQPVSVDFNTRQVLIRSMVTCLRDSIDFTNQANVAILFNTLPENAAKMAIRFLYADANNGQLIDTMNINTIRAKLAGNQNLVDLSACFTDSKAYLLQHLAIFVELSASLYSCNNTILNLKQNDLGSNGQLSAAFQHLAGLTGLANLNLSLNDLGINGQLPAAFQHLSGLTNLTSLDLSSNSLGGNGQLLAVFQHLSGLTGLADLNLSFNSLGSNRQLPAAFQHLAGLTGLINLDLSMNVLGINGQLPAAFQHLAGLTGLADLNLEYNSLGISGQLPAVFQHLAGLTGLTNLHLSLNDLGINGQLPAAFQHLSGLTNLTSLDLSSNSLGSNGQLPAAFQHLAGLTGLTSLDLSFNSLGSNGQLPAAFQHLAGLTGLTSLNLSFNSLGSNGQLPAAFQHFAGLTGLISLNLSINALGSNGQLPAAFQHLSGLTNLTSLDLSSNSLGGNNVPQALRDQLGNGLRI